MTTLSRYETVSSVIFPPWVEDRSDEVIKREDVLSGAFFHVIKFNCFQEMLSFCLNSNNYMGDRLLLARILGECLLLPIEFFLVEHKITSLVIEEDVAEWMKKFLESINATEEEIIYLCGEKITLTLNRKYFLILVTLN